MNLLKDLWTEEDAVGVVEIILILVDKYTGTECCISCI